MPAPRKYTHEQLRSSALALVDRQGLAALTMRGLADTLGTGPMTIYNYVDGREGLERLVAEAVLAEATWSVEPGARWWDEVASVAEGMWAAVRAHPHAIPLILTRRGLDATALGVAEALLSALARGGRSGTELLVAFRVVSGFIAGAAQAELAGPLVEDAAEVTIGRMAALPPESFPRLVEIAHAATTSEPREEFRAGLRVILAGLRATVSD